MSERAPSERLPEALSERLAAGEVVWVSVELAAPRGVSPAARDAIQRAQERALARVAGSGFELTHRFASVPAMGGRITSAGARALLGDPGVLRIDEAPGGGGAMVEAFPLSGLDALDEVIDGAATSIAVVDTGFDSDHPDLSGALAGEYCTCSPGCCPDGSGNQTGAGSAEDDHGHGTFIAGLVTSDGVDAPTGALPDASIVAVKMLDAQNRYQTSLDITRSLDWIATSGLELQAVNLSLGSDARYAGACDEVGGWTRTMAAAVQNLVDAGVTVTAASMNAGDSTGISVPACLSNVIAVAATWDSTGALGTITSYSNTSEAVDVLAPGSVLTSSKLGGGSSSGSGTSFASPQVAICAAALRVATDPAPDVAAIRALLTANPARTTDPDNGLSFPNLDCELALSRLDGDGDGVPVSVDNCPDVFNPDQANADGDAFGDACDVCAEGAPDVDMDGICDAADLCPEVSDPEQRDADEDGVGDACDACPLDVDDDADGDGVCGDVDLCPGVSDPEQLDGDTDGVGDACDDCPDDAQNDADGDGVCGDVDLCPEVRDPEQRDTDEDGLGDACDACLLDPDNDIDRDRLCAERDVCPEVFDPKQLDGDGDGLGDACDDCPLDAANDVDGDGVCGDVDRCPEVGDPEQRDSDRDGLGDACDDCPDDVENDVDGDGVCGDLDRCPSVSDPEQRDADEDGLGDACDGCPLDAANDVDGDGVCGDVDLCPEVSDPEQRDADEDGVGDACDACPLDADDDADGDGVCGDVDLCPNVSDPEQLDGDEDGVGDVCDVCVGEGVDGDGDGVCDAADLCPEVGDPEQLDTDGDGVGDACDMCPEGGCDEPPEETASDCSCAQLSAAPSRPHPGLPGLLLIGLLVLRRRLSSGATSQPHPAHRNQSARPRPR